MVIPIRLAPYVRDIRRLFLGRGSVQSAAYRQEVLCAEEKTTNRPAIFLPGQLDRITGTSIHSTKEGEIAAATSQTATHAPTIAYHIKNAVLFDGSIYCGRFKYFVADRSLFSSRTSEPRHLKTVGLASSALGNKYFFHWLSDDCIAYLLAMKHGQPLCLRRPVYREGHQPKYEAYFDQEWTPTDRAWIDNLIVYQDFAQNSLKRTRYRTLRERVGAQISCAGRRSLVYLRRGALGAPRVIQNEGEIIDVLVRYGFVVVDIELDSLEHLLGVLASAKVVVSIEGSNIAHCLFSVPENSGLIVLQPPDRFETAHLGWSQCLGMRFGFVVGVLGERGYRFSSSEILCTVDLMLRSIELEPAAG